MIKTLLNADEDPPPGTKVVVEETVLNPPPAEPPRAAESAPETAPEKMAEYTAPPENFEIPEDAKFFAAPVENVAENAAETLPLDEDAESLSALMEEIESLAPEDFDRLEREIENAPRAETSAETPIAPQTAAQIDSPPREIENTNFETPPAPTVAAANLFDDSGAPFSSEETTEKSGAATDEPTIFQSDYTPPTTAETIRNSGLAWSAGIVFFGAVIFMMIFGWFADLLFGSSPWGLVGGIILGGLIGFIQFFRITSQIFKK